MKPDYLPLTRSHRSQDFNIIKKAKPIITIKYGPGRDQECHDPFDTLKNCIEKHATTSLIDQQFDQIRKFMRVKKLKKRQIFLEEGEICKYYGFIVKGAMRQYSIDDKGIEYMVQLSLENSWVGDLESWVMLSPTIYTIDAWEDTQMVLVTKEDAVRLALDIPAFDEMLRSMDKKNAIATQKRVNAAISLPADKRYYDFASNYPEFVQRFPQHVIASYLGIAKETLSRIRRSQLLK